MLCSVVKSVATVERTATSFGRYIYIYIYIQKKICFRLDLILVWKGPFGHIGTISLKLLLWRIPQLHTVQNNMLGIQGWIFFFFFINLNPQEFHLSHFVTIIPWPVAKIMTINRSSTILKFLENYTHEFWNLI